MTKPGAKKTPALLASQKQHNERRRAARAALKKERLQVPRDGARELLVSKLVGDIVRRMLKRARNREARPPLTAAQKQSSRKRTREWYQKNVKDVSAETGKTTNSVLKERSLAHKARPLVFYNDRAKHKLRRQTDAAYDICCRLRTRLGEFLRLTNSTKAKGTMELVGCTKQQLVERLTERMADKSADLRQKSIDHIFPMSLYDAEDQHQQLQMMHWSNLQPLELTGTGGNISKGNRLPSRKEAMLVERWAWPTGVDESMLCDDSIPLEYRDSD